MNLFVCVDETRRQEEEEEEEAEEDEEGNQSLLKAVCTDTSVASSIFFCGSGCSCRTEGTFCLSVSTRLHLDFLLPIKLQQLLVFLKSVGE